MVHTIPMGAGGISNLTMTINEKINREEFEFDYLVFRNQEEFCDERARRLGSSKLIADISSVSNPIKKGIAKIKGTKKILAEGKYHILHIDASTPYDVVLAIGAKLAGVKTIIFHAHNDNYEHKRNLRNALMPFYRIMIPFCITDYIAISENAAKFMFPKKVVANKSYRLIKNGIDVNKYIYSSETRKRYREEYGWNDSFVVGHIGRFVYQKNHEFLIEVFKEIKRKKGNAVLLLIGIGEMQEKIREKVSRLGLADSVIFWGVTEDIPNLMQAMDAFVFPSRYEGLGMVAIEAQAASLPTVVADTLPKETEITDCIKKVSLNESPERWAEIILDEYWQNTRRDRSIEIQQSGYDINAVVRDLEEFYREKN